MPFPKENQKEKKSITYYSKLREAIFHLHVSNILPPVVGGTIPVVGGTIQHYLSQGKKRNKDHLFILPVEFELSSLLHQLNIHHSEAALQMKH